MNKHFFPDPAFGWSFFAFLIILLALAAVVDLRTARIPKSLTITLAIAGLIANGVRGFWLGSQGRETWVMETGSAWLGAVDGMLFSLVGLLFAFGLFFGMWVLGACGGGDIKLFAGIGAWIGALLTIFLLLVTVVALVVWVGVTVVSGGKVARKTPARPGAKKQMPVTAPGRRMTFSLPAAVSAAVVMLWSFRFDLQLEQPQAAPENEDKHALVGPAWQ